MSLLDLLKRLPTLNEIKGSVGEYFVKYYSDIVTDGLILHDVLIEGVDGYTTQMDLIIVGLKGIYVVEVKNFEGAKIYGDGKKSKWYYYRGGKKYEIYSPIKQNKKHIEYLKRFLNDFGEIPYFSVVTVLCDDLKVTNVNEDSDNRQTVMCNSLPAMERGMRFLSESKPIIFDKEKQQEIYDFIANNQIEGKEARKEHKENTEAYKNTLDEFKNKKICPYCKKEMVLRKGKYGEFYGCSNYPQCKYTLKTE